MVAWAKPFLNQESDNNSESRQYSAGWNGPGPLPMSGMPTSATASYPPSTIPAADPYQKIPVSGASGYSHEPAELPLQTSMPSMQLSLAATDQQQPPPIRAQYAYVPGTSAPSQLSVTTPALGSSTGSADHSALSVPRYVDSNPRPTKSPRHGSHPSTSSLTNNDATSEYRYGPPVTTTYENSSTYGTSSAEGTSGAPASAGSSHAPPRDYYPPTSSWTTTAGETSSSTVHAYHNGPGASESRPYTYPDQYKTGHSISVKSEHPAAPSNYNYSWSST